MKHLHILFNVKLYLFILIILLFCSEKSRDGNPLLPTDNNPIQIKVGDSWLYRRTFVIEGMQAILGFPDTLIGYTYFKAVKDTVINSLNCIVVEGKDYEIAKNEINILTSRFAYHLSDSAIIEYTYTESQLGFSIGIMKCQSSDILSKFKKNYGTMLLKKLSLQRLLNDIRYDTLVFRDLVYPIRYPLEINKPFYYRDIGDPKENVSMGKEYLGQETIEINGNKYQCFIFTYLYGDFIENINKQSRIIFREYVSSIGLVKRYMEQEMQLTDSIKTMSYDITEFIGRNAINPDTLKPWGNE